MSAIEALGFGFVAIVVMGVTTFLMRAGGFWMMSHVPLTPGVQRMLEALPGSIVAAIVLPAVVSVGPAAVLATATAAIVMAVRRNEFLAVAAGLVAAIIARSAGV